MPVVELQNATLESTSTPSDTSGSGRSSFSLFDSIIKQRSTGRKIMMNNNNEHAMWKRVPMDPEQDHRGHHSGGEGGVASLKGGKHTFSTMVESLSNSSDEMMTSMSKSFSLFKTSSSQREEDESRHDMNSRQEQYDDEARAWTAIPVVTSITAAAAATERDKLMSPTDRTRQLLDNLAISSEPDTEDSNSINPSPLQSVQSGSSDGSDHSHSSWEVAGSREFSLLDDATSVGNETYQTNEGDDLTLGFDDDLSPRSLDTYASEYPEEDALAVLGGILYQIGSCNFGQAQDVLTGTTAATGLSFEDDIDEEGDYSVLSDALAEWNGLLRRGRSTTPRSLGPNAARQSESQSQLESDESYFGFSQDREIQTLRGVSSTFDVVREDPPPRKSFFQSMFGCNGGL